MSSVVRRCIVVAVLAAGLVLVPVASHAQVGRSNVAAHGWVTDGQVLAVAATASAVYVGGDFSLIGRPTGAWVGVTAAGTVGPIRRFVEGSVYEAVGDGRGGWFLLGDIGAVGGVEIENTEVVHLGANGRLDRRWSLVTDGEVYTLARHRDTLYVGGSFSRLNRAPRASVAAVNARTGAVLDWKPRVGGASQDVDPSVYALSVTRDGKTVYLGGSFGRVNGQRRGSVAAVTSAGAVTPFDPQAAYEDAEAGWASVYVLALDPRGRIVYLGGDFETVGGMERAGLAAVGARRGGVSTWNPDCDGEVNALRVASAGSPVYVAGEFASIGGKSRRGLAAVDARRGLATVWDPNIGGSVNSLVLAPERKLVYVGGEFSSVGDADRANLAALDLRTAEATAWDPRAVGPVYATAPDGKGGLVVGGELVSVGAQPRNGLASLTADGGSVTPWQPPFAGTVRALAPDPGGARLYVGGRFRLGETRTQQSLAVIDVASGSLATYGPAANGAVWAIAPSADGRTVYIGGGFGTLGGKTRRRIAALDAADGSLGTWAAGANGVVRALAVSDDVLYAAGQFGTIGGETRKGVAALDVTTGRATGWEAGSNDNVYAVAELGETLYVGGEFTAIGGRSRKHLAGLDTGDGSATRWDPSPDDVIYALQASSDGSRLIAAGDFERVGGGRRDVGEFDVASGFVTAWRPEAPFYGRALAIGADGRVFVGGEGALAVFR